MEVQKVVIFLKTNYKKPTDDYALGYRSHVTPLLEAESPPAPRTWQLVGPRPPRLSGSLRPLGASFDSQLPNFVKLLGESFNFSQSCYFVRM